MPAIWAYHRAFLNVDLASGDVSVHRNIRKDRKREDKRQKTHLEEDVMQVLEEVVVDHFWDFFW